MFKLLLELAEEFIVVFTVRFCGDGFDFKADTVNRWGLTLHVLKYVSMWIKP